MLAELGIVAPAGLPEGIAGITADSRRVRPGMVYAALPGVRADGRDYIGQAVAGGAVAVLTLPGTTWPEGVPARPMILDAQPRRALALLAALHAGPQPRTVIAVTGTNGKTSTAEFVRQLQTMAGRRAASLGTLGLVGPDGATGPGLTTPDPVTLAETLAALARDGVEAVALEASSHGLEQCRLDGVRLAAAGFTNLTRDHLDYHGTMDAYRAAKLRLFSAVLPCDAPAVVCADLEPALLSTLREMLGPRLHTVGEGGSLVRLMGARPVPGGQVLDVEVAGGCREIRLALPGRFQADNALLAAGLALVTGTDAALDLLPGLRGVRGRMELAAVLPNGAAVYVDYAHTPDALDRLLRALRPHTRDKLHVVFGAGGDRDPGKRPLMGAAAAQADRLIVTDDNPRTEDAACIRAAVLEGCPGALEIGDRAAAIAAALNDLGPGDVLVVAGKGHEQGQTVGTGTLPFDDVSVVRGLAGLA